MTASEHNASSRTVVGAVLGGLIAGVIGIAVSISFAALVFRGDLGDALPTGIGLSLVGSSILGFVAASRSAFPFAIAGVQDSTAAILAVATAGLATQVAGAPLPTTVAVIVTATVVMGAVLYTVGRLRLGEVARYMPFPVVGGFLVATGFLLIQGAAGILGRGQSGVELLEFSSIMLWVPGVVVGCALYAAGRFIKSTLATPIALLVVTVGWRLGIALAGVDAAHAMERGWLLGPFPTDVTWSPDTLRLVGDADWGAVAGAWLPILSIALVAVISLLLYVHALEHVSGTDVDANRELRVAGLAGVLAGAAGGLPGFLYFSNSTLLLRFAGRRRLAAIIAALLPLVVVGFGTTVLGLIPVAVIGGVLLSLGLSFVVEWLWDARVRLGRVDHALVLVIGAAVVVAGFLAAIAIGLVIAIGLFVVRYSRVDVVRRSYTLAAESSTLDRPPDQQRALAENGDEVRVLEVHGYLFFGTASGLFGEHQLAAAADRREPCVVLYDLSAISGIDSSTVMALQRFDRQAQARNLTVVFAGLPEQFRRAIAPAIAEARTGVHEFADVDTAIQWCEDGILDRALGSHEPTPIAEFRPLVERMLRGAGPADAVLRHADRITLPEGTVVIKAGEPQPGLYFLESGRLSVFVLRPDGTTLRLRQMLSGSVIGEISLYRGGGAAADVVADQDCVLWHLALDDIDRLERDDPAAAAAIHRFAASILAERMVHANRRVTRS
jgi:SulP family sulfate permease